MILLAAALAAATPQVIEAFDSSEDWTAQASDGVTSSISSVPGVQGKALRLDYDFHNVSGYAYTRHLTAVTFPENYELRFRIRGTPSTNDLQLKFTDAKGENVWWYQARDFRPSAEWQTIRIRRRDLSFAWGPTTDKTLRNTAAIELVVVRGRDGGKGSVEIDQLELTPLPANPPALPAPIASDAKAIDGNRATLARFSARRPLTIDFGGFREIGGVTLHWGEDWISTYDIEASDEGRRWRLLRKAASNGGDDPIPLPGAEVRMIRIVPTGAAERAESVPLPEIEIMPIEWSATPNAVIAALAREAPRGTYPRAFTEQSYWTLVGADGAQDSGLIGEDAAIEAGTGGFSVEPFVIDNERRFTWADVTATQTLAEGYLPIPTVTWTGPGFTLETSVFADVAAPKGRLMARYRLTNTGGEARYIRLLLAARPYQVNPPAQFLSQQGGVSPIHWIAQDDTGFVLRKPWPTPEGPERHLQPRPMPDWTAMAEFDDGDAIDEWRYLYQNDPLESDDNDAASAAMTWNPQLAAGETKEVVVAIPLDGTEPPADLTFEKADYDKARAAALAYWRDRLNTVQITVPAAYRRIPDSIRTATAHILMSRAGPMLKPGTRSYNRSWIRDGAMISDGLLRLGLDRPVAEYADWYSGYLFANGKVPCCVDYRGADPVPENDSHGEFIHLITQLYRFTGDRARLEAGWPRLLAAQRYMESLRQSERKPDNPPHLYGLMPPSISHEGYSAKPQYSLWDDFWALRGYKDAAFAAAVLGKPEAVQIAAERDQFQSDLHTAIAAAAAHWKIDYIPGATSLGDLDATSTTMAFDTAGEQSWLDPRLLAGTFERYWQNFVARRDGKLAWKDYTPYEIRNVSAFVRLGWRERANELLDFFFRDQRPQGWNQWAEVVGKDPREIRFIGDMPHAWVASDYIRSALDMFAYEADDGAIVLAAGLLPDMLAGEGSGIRGLRTTQGILSYAISATPDRLTLTIEPGAMPKAGFRLPWPFHGTPGKALIDGKPARFNPAGLSIPATGKAIRVEVDRR